MELTGKNLSLTKKALDKYITYCSMEGLRASDLEAAAMWDPEIKEAQELLIAVEVNIKREEENNPPALRQAQSHPPEEGPNGG
jgi:DNA polymerase III delta subunit